MVDQLKGLIPSNPFSRTQGAEVPQTDPQKPVETAAKSRYNILGRMFGKDKVVPDDGKLASYKGFTFNILNRQSSLEIEKLHFIDDKLHLFKVVSKDDLYKIHEKGLDASSPEKALNGQYASVATPQERSVVLVVRLPKDFAKAKETKISFQTVDNVRKVWIDGFTFPSTHIYVVDEKANEEKLQFVEEGTTYDVNITPLKDFIGKQGLMQSIFNTDAAKKYDQAKAITETKLGLITTLQKCKTAIDAYKGEADPKKKGELMAMFRSALNAIEGYQGAVRKQARFEKDTEAAAKAEADRLERCSVANTLNNLGTQPGGIQGATVGPVTPAVVQNEKPALGLGLNPIQPAPPNVVDPNQIKLKEINGGKPRRKKANGASAATAPPPRPARRPRRPS